MQTEQAPVELSWLTAFNRELERLAVAKLAHAVDIYRQRLLKQSRSVCQRHWHDVNITGETANIGDQVYCTYEERRASPV
jgi:hypothetical protein